MRSGPRPNGCAQNLTQEALAHAAGISLSTLRRFEKTGDIALASFVEIAFALRRMDGFDALFPEPPVHSLFEAAPRERQAREEARCVLKYI